MKRNAHTHTHTHTQRWGARGAMVIDIGYEHGKQVHILDEAVCIPLIANTNGKDMRQTILYEWIIA